MLMTSKKRDVDFVDKARNINLVFHPKVHPVGNQRMMFGSHKKSLGKFPRRVYAEKTNICHARR